MTALPGISVQTAVVGALITGLGLTEDLKAGVVDRFRSLLMAGSAVLLGRTAADAVMNVMTLALMLLVGVAARRPDGAGSCQPDDADRRRRQGDAIGPALGTLAWLAGLLLVFVPLAVRAFRHA